MTNTIISLYLTLTPVIVGGVINSAFCSSDILNKLAKPIDLNKNFIDGKRIFGNNKTFKGLLGYVIFITSITILWGLLSQQFNYLAQHNFFYINHDISFLYSLQIGILLGLAWPIFELPNSFIKRRLNIGQSNAIAGFAKVFFIVLDQADSIFGIMLVVAIYYPITLAEYFAFVVIGTVTHLFFNYLLFLAKLRKQPV